MRIALIGYGKMGKTIHQIALEQNDEIAFIIDQDNASDLFKMNSTNVDVAIEFSNPESAFINIKYCLENGIPIISGTTGWLAHYNQALKICKDSNGSFMYASNFSIGVNVFFELNKFLAKKMKNYLQYKINMEEIHHIQKLDSPSGTAITLADGILENNENLSKWVNNITPNDTELCIVSKRIENVPGTHSIKYVSDIDEIEIVHTAHSRLGFAQGAYDAAKWLKDKKGVYSIQDMLFG